MKSVWVRIQGGINPGLSLMQGGIQLEIAEGYADKAREFFRSL